jgi:tetratricopeptide (TPR) repeat protein
MGLFNNLFGKTPKAAADAVKRGDGFAQQDDCRQAITCYSEALGLGMGTARVLLNRGECYRALGEQDAAMQDFTAALRLDAKAVQGHFFWRGQDLGEKGQRELEIAQYDVVLQIDPQFALGFAARGNAYRELGQYQCAVADLTQALGLEPRADYFLNRGLAHHGAGNIALAVADYTEAIRLEPERGALYASRAAAYRLAGDDAKAALDDALAQRYR